MKGHMAARRKAMVYKKTKYMYILKIMAAMISFKLLEFCYTFALVFAHCYVFHPGRDLNEHLGPKSYMIVRPSLHILRFENN
jgi:hypothetical protein